MRTIIFSSSDIGDTIKCNHAKSLMVFYFVLFGQLCHLTSIFIFFYKTISNCKSTKMLLIKKKSAPVDS